MIYRKQRRRDIKRTKILELEADKIYKENNINFNRIKDKDKQQAGIDLIIDKDNVDEKFKIQSYNKDIETLSFEISNDTNKNKAGWLVQENSETTHYMIMLVKSKDKYFNNLQKIELIYISKEKIINYLKNKGFNNEIIKEFENNSVIFNNNKISYMKDLKIVQSLQTVEKSINILISKEDLINLADRTFVKIYKKN